MSCGYGCLNFFLLKALWELQVVSVTTLPTEKTDAMLCVVEGDTTRSELPVLKSVTASFTGVVKLCVKCVDTK